MVRVGRDPIPARRAWTSGRSRRDASAGPGRSSESNADTRQSRVGLVAPAAVEVQPLEAGDRCAPVFPGELGLGRIGVRRDRHAAEPQHVFHDSRRFASERIRRGGHVERDQVAAVGADLDGVDAEHAVQVRGRIGRARGIAVVGDHHELQSGARRRRGDRLAVAGAVGPGAVHVKRAGDGSRADRVGDAAGGGRRARRQRRQQPKKNGGQNGRRQSHRLACH